MLLHMAISQLMHMVQNLSYKLMTMAPFQLSSQNIDKSLPHN